MADGKKTSTRALNVRLESPDERLLLGTGALRGAVDYLPVPPPSRRRKPLARPWRIALIYTGNPKADVTGLEIYDDVVLGRPAGRVEVPDLDLTPYGAAEHGVSRRHALLRPTTNQLFLIDLGSTNGTQVNSVPQETGMARALKHNDTVSLGNLHLTVKIMHRPGGTTQKEAMAKSDDGRRIRGKRNAET